MRLTNRGQGPLPLEVRCGAVLKTKSPASAWDGYEEHAPPSARGARRDLAQTFPMTCVCAPRAGIAIGLMPDTLCSWLEHTFDTAAPQQAGLSQGVRVIVDAGQTETVSFVVFGFRPAFGHLDALQTYYDEFPEWFRPAGEVDPRVTGGGAAYGCWTRNEPEMCRRFFGDWDWCYAPFRRTGDWYGRAEFWDYKPARAFTKDRDMPREQFLRARAEQFDRGRHCDTAMFFYLPANIWCEIQLAQQRYKDAIVLRDDGSGIPKPIEHHSPWVTGHDDELIVFPWATTFAEACMRDMRQIVAELNVAGFAFDTANGGIPYRGPGGARSPGRAWDDQGAFVDLGIAVAKMQDFAHTLRTRDGRRCALVSNPTGRTIFPICFRSDSAMHEYPPYRQINDQRALRHLLGRKTMVWWDDYNAAPLLKWREMSPADIRQAFLGLADFVLLRSLHMGGIPTPRLTMGVPRLVEALPMIHEVVRAGWQPAPAFKVLGERAADRSLWTARYGDGLGTFLALCNASAAEFDGQIEVENRYLGNAAHLFAPCGDGRFTQTLIGRTTRLPAKVESRRAAVLKAALALPADWEGLAGVEQGDGRLRFDFTGSTPRAGVVRLRVPPDCRLARLTVNDHATDFAEDDGVARFKLRADCRAVIVAEFESRHLAEPRRAILDFAFDQAVIVLPRDAGAAQQQAAKRLQEYFRFFNAQSASRSAWKPPQIVERANRSEQQGVIRFGDGRTRLEGGDLVVNPSPAAMQALLRWLDQRYFFAGRFPRSGEGEGELELLKKSGLGGGVLE